MKRVLILEKELSFSLLQGLTGLVCLRATSTGIFSSIILVCFIILCYLMHALLTPDIGELDTVLKEFDTHTCVQELRVIICLDYWMPHRCCGDWR